MKNKLQNIEQNSIPLSTSFVFLNNRARGEKQRDGKVYIKSCIKNKGVVMRNLKIPTFIIFILSIIFITGCQKDTIVDPGTITEDDYLKQQAISAEEVAGYIQNEEVSIEDEYEKDMNYDEFGILKTTDPITPIKWARKIDRVVKTLLVEQINDTIKVVTIVKDISGRFIIKAIKDSNGITDTVRIIKPYTSTITRKVRFLKINNNNEFKKNWKPIAITLVEGKTNTKNFIISTLEVMTSVDTATITDPLTYWVRFAPGRGGVSLVKPGDAFIIRVTVTSENPQAEYACLRTGLDSGFKRHRARFQMDLVSESESNGIYTRVYQKVFAARLPMGISFGHMNAIVDVMSYNSINDDSAPYMNSFWGMPYLVKRF